MVQKWHESLAKHYADLHKKDNGNDPKDKGDKHDEPAAAADADDKVDEAEELVVPKNKNEKTKAKRIYKTNSQVQRNC